MSGMVFVTVVLSVCADYGGVNVFHVSLNLTIWWKRIRVWVVLWLCMLR